MSDTGSLADSLPSTPQTAPARRASAVFAGVASIFLLRGGLLFSLAGTLPRANRRFMRVRTPLCAP